MKVSVLIFQLLIFLSPKYFYTQASNIDSLKAVLASAKKQNEKIFLMNKLAYEFRNTDSNLSLDYANQALKLSEQFKNIEGISDASATLGIAWRNLNNKDSSYYFLDKSYKTALSVNYIDGIVKSLNSKGLYLHRDKKTEQALDCYKEAYELKDKVADGILLNKLYNNMAMLFRSLGEYQKAIEFYLEALYQSEQLKDETGIAIISSNLALVYEKQKQYDLALQLLLKALEIRRKNNDVKGESIVLNNIGLIYEGKKEFNLALDYYNKSLAIRSKFKQSTATKKGMALLYSNIGIIYKELEKYDSAYFFYQKAIDLRSEIGDRNGIIHTTINLGVLYKELGQPEKALMFFNKAEVLAKELNGIEELYRIYKSKPDINYELKNYKEAFLNLKEYINYYEQLYSISSRTNIEKLQTKYESLKKETEKKNLIQQNELKEAKLNRRFYSLIVIGLTLLFMFILTYFLYRNQIRLKRLNNRLIKNRSKIESQKKLLNQSLEEIQELVKFKEEMMNMIIHDLKNPLNTIINLAELELNEQRKDIIIHSGKRMYNLVLNLLDVYTYENAKLHIQTSEIYFSDVVKNAVNSIESFAKRKNISICFSSKEDYKVRIDKSLMERTLINLLQNAIQFSDLNSTVEMYINPIDNNLFSMVIKDHGTGIKKENQERIFEKFYTLNSNEKNSDYASHGIGLAFSKMVIEKHGGKIGLISEYGKGSEFWIELNYLEKSTFDKNKLTDVNCKKNSKTSFQLQKDEKLQLLPFIKKLETMEVYAATNVKELINEIEQLNILEIKPWIIELREALTMCNQEKFQLLINSLLNEEV